MKISVARHAQVLLARPVLSSPLRKGVLTAWIAVGLIAFGCVSARADILTQTVTKTPSGSDNNVTNSDVLTVFSVTPTFNEFNSSLGTLLSATLTWSASGSLTVTGNNEGQVIMSYDTSSDPEGWNIFGGSTAVGLSISGTDSLGLAGVTGTGTFNEGPFLETYQLQQGYFIPAATFSTGSTSGTFTLTYDYTPPGAPPPPPPSVPEISSVSSLSTAVLLLFAIQFARSRRKGVGQA